MPLKFKTRGMSTPKGKPRVYFSAHPKDHLRFFREISDSILEHQNCAVWYTDEAAPELPAHLEDLKQMQLFVIPVSRELLTQNSFAMDVEIPFAIENHIPVLPLIQEPGLMMLYPQKFGNLQFLDANARDPSAIQYEDKLAGYLSSILIGEKLTARIRTAFDAYIFLSYRKKDRRHAQELMRLIHKHDFCRDFAIWYDEFLVPGEDFQDAIRDALHKCDMFVLAVTPNLLEEGNYIMTTEYPMAVQSRKPILPAELIPTDPSRLAAGFQGIPASFRASDSRMLARSLADAARAPLLRKTDNSPEHDYLIGLAYLGGVDMEVDQQRGVELIKAAAEANLDEAMEWLVTMYRTGHGVEHSTEQSLFWLEKLAALRHQQYEAQRTAHSLDRLLSVQCRCGDYALERSLYPQAETQYRSAEALLEASAFGADPMILRDHAMICFRLQDTLLRTGKMDTASAYAARGLALTESLAQQVRTPEAEQQLSAAYLKQGDNHLATGDLQRALPYYEKSLALRKRHAAATGTMDARRDLVITYNRLVKVNQHLGRLDALKKYNDACLILCEQLAKEAGTIQSKRDLSICYNLAADLAEVQADRAAALKFARKYVAASEEILQSADTVDARRNQYVSYQKYGDVLFAAGARAEAKAYYEKGHRLCEALSNAFASAEVGSDLAISYYRLALVASAFQRSKYRKLAEGIKRKLLREYPDAAPHLECMQIS